MLAVVWLVLMVGAFYLLLWKPQQRRMRAARTVQSELVEGDQVLTTSGIYGTIVSLGDTDLELEIAPSTIIRVARGAVGQRLEPDSYEAHGDAPRDDHDDDPGVN